MRPYRLGAVNLMGSLEGPPMPPGARPHPGGAVAGLDVALSRALPARAPTSAPTSGESRAFALLAAWVGPNPGSGRLEVVGQTLAEEETGAVDPGLHRGQADPEGLGDVGIGQALDVVKHDGG